MWKKLFARLRPPRIHPEYRELFSQDDGQIVSLDCETTSLNIPEAELLSIAAVKIHGKRILSSAAFQVLVQPRTAPGHENVRIHGLRPSDVRDGLPPEDALRGLLDFIGGRTLIGYYLDYDIAVLEKYLRPMLGGPLPNRKIEISSRYYDWRQRLYPGSYIDLHWDVMVDRLDIPMLPRHDAMNDAIMVGMMYLALEGKTAGRMP
ncbi:MAG: 3'-5' exonuclease [Zoogloeaceae bacterium]|jgi:DNA polymerase-3 subunit epsilon|nr:3'-5' exonuclease [Zoogloeaceae bacterium]